MKKNFFLGLLLYVIILVLDQIIKAWVESNLPFHQAVEILPFFSLYYTFNTGIAFSFLSFLSPTMLVGFTVLITLIMLFLWWFSRHDGLLSSLGFGMILGGALGNIIDRAFYGHVIDYVLLHGFGYSFAVFNLADSALTLGVFLILLSTIIGKGPNSG